MTSKGDIEKFKDEKVAKAIASFIPSLVLSRVVRNPEKLDRVGERRTVTAMFVDIAGFTPYCENRDAEEVMLLLNRLFSAILEPVNKYSGEVDKFMGDAAIIIFGAPVAHEDDPQRALASSIEILGRVKEFESLDVSIGINTGEVVAGIVGNDSHREYTVIGDAVNTASRLQSSAGAGEILVGSETVRMAGAGFVFGKKRRLSLKGKTEEIEAYPLEKIESAISNHINLPLTGRELEFRRAVKFLESDTGSLAIEGQAGTGKTALLAQIADSALSLGYRILDISAITWAENIPYAPVQHFIRELLGENPAEIFERILPARAEFFPLLSGLLRMDIEPNYRTEYLSPDEKRTALREILTELLTASAGTSPTLIVCDNTENLDPSTADLINGIVSRKQLSIIISGRDLNALATTPGVKIRLDTFGKDKTGRLVREILGAKRIGKDLLDAVHSETGGNPGYIVELVSLLADRGGIVVDRGVHRLSASIEGQLPRTIDGIYTARIDEFPADARETLRVLSVLGQDFPRDIPEHLIDDSIFENGRDFLLSNGILRAIDGRYRFQSGPFMKAAYHSLFQTVRKRMHESAGQVIESIYGESIEDHYEELARHYSLGEREGKAFHYRYLSGLKQERRFANREALYYYESALEIDDDTAIQKGLWQELLGALEAAGKLLWYSGDLNGVIELNMRAKKIAERQDATPLFTDAINRIALAKQELGAFEEAGKLYGHLLTILDREENQVERRLQAMVNYGTLLSDLGRLDEARKLYLQGLEIVDISKASAGAANLLGNLGWLEGQMENLESAAEYLQRAGEIDQEMGNLRGQAINMVNLAQIHRARGKINLEIEAYNRALDIFSKIGDRRGEALCLSNLGDTAREKGEIEAAKSLHRKALKLATELSDKMRIVDAQLGLALDSHAEGDVKSAIRRAESALNISETIGDWEGQIETGMALLRFYRESNMQKPFEKLSKKLRQTIMENNPAAISRLESLNE